MSKLPFLIKELQETWSLIIKKYPLVILASFLDLVYYVSFSFSLYNFYNNVSFHIRGVYSALGASVKRLEDLSPDSLQLGLQNQDQILYHYGQIAYHLAILAAIMLVLWFVLQSINWYLAHRINGHKINPHLFFFRFVTSTLIGMLLIAVIIFLSVNISVQLVKTPLSLFNSDIINWVSVFLFLGVIYLLFSSYSLIHNLRVREHHRHILKNLETKLGGFAIAAGIIFIANGLLWKLLYINTFTTILWGVFFTLPSYTFCRVYFLRIMKK